MELSRNHYRKFLVDEVMRSSNADISIVFSHVTEFSKTKDFEESYKKWIYLTRQKQIKYYRPKLIREIFEAMGF